MKSSSFRILIRGIKALVIITIIIFSSLFILAMKAEKMASDVWTQLGLTIPDANRNIKNSFLYGNFQYYGAKNAKNILLGDRKAVISQIVSHSKKYYSGTEFKTAYQEYRLRHKPDEPMKLPITAESLKADEKIRLANNLKAAEDGLNSPNPKIKNGAPARIENIKKEIAALEAGNSPTIKKRLDDAERSYQYALKLHEQALLKWQQQYPEDPKEILKKRLQAMLDITSDVDYGAELKEVNKKKLFVNPDYEKKPKEWKLAYRAGKETTDAVREAAQQWLNELK